MSRGKQSSRLFVERGGRFYENFSARGHRFRGSLATDRLEEAATRSALRYAAAVHSDEAYQAAVRAETDPIEVSFAAADGPPIVGRVVDPRDQTLEEVCGTYWLQHAQHTPSADNLQRMIRTLLHGIKDRRGRIKMMGLSANKRVRDLTIADLRNYAARRRALVSNRSVNCEFVCLRAALNWAKQDGVPVPEFRWKRDNIMLPEAGERESILSAEEEARLFAALRPDYHALVRFALLSGLRLDNVISLTWRQVDWDAREIRLRVKGGKQKAIAISSAMLAILEGERGRNFQRVFTFECRRNRHDRHAGIVQNKGERYPFSSNGWRVDWKRALAAAGIEDFRFHDLRHTFATRLLRATNNLELVRQALTHEDIATTVRYAKSQLSDVRLGLEKMGNLTQNLTQNRISAGGKIEKPR
jgi:integrase